MEARAVKLAQLAESQASRNSDQSEYSLGRAPQPAPDRASVQAPALKAGDSRLTIPTEKKRVRSRVAEKPRDLARTVAVPPLDYSQLQQPLSTAYDVEPGQTLREFIHNSQQAAREWKKNPVVGLRRSGFSMYCDAECLRFRSVIRQQGYVSMLTFVHALAEEWDKMSGLQQLPYEV